MVDNAENMRGMERRVQSLSATLASPVTEDDYAEKGRREELRRFVFNRVYISLLIPLSGGSIELLRSWNRSLTSMLSPSSYEILTMPKY